MSTRVAAARENGRHRQSSIDHLRPVAAIPYTLIACFNQHRELLMVKRNKPPFVGCWNFLGGKIDLGETPAAAAIREIREEASRNAAPRSLNFRGIALWPDPSDLNKYVGMYLFFLGCKTRNTQNKQLGLLHEGVTAWISLDLLLAPSEFKPVPNFELIASQILATRLCPRVICHEVDGTEVRELWSYAIMPKNQAIVKRPQASHLLKVADLITRS